MKEETRLIKSLGQQLYGSKGKTKKKIAIERRKYLLFETQNKQKLALEHDPMRRYLNIFKESDLYDSPSYQIPESFLENDYEFGKCPTCGNLAITSTHGTMSSTICIEPPNFHRFTIDNNKGKARE
jgi:hypothetical protein